MGGLTEAIAAAAIAEGAADAGVAAGVGTAATGAGAAAVAPEVAAGIGASEIGAAGGAAESASALGAAGGLTSATIPVSGQIGELAGAAGAAGGAGAGTGSSGIFGTGVSTGSSIVDSAAQGVGINLGEDVVTGQTPTPQGLLEAAGTGAAGGALTGGVSGAPTTAPTSGSPALTGGTGLGAAATAAPASLTAGGGDAALGVGGGDVTAGTPPASGAAAPAGAPGAPRPNTITGSGTAAGSGATESYPAATGPNATGLPANTGGASTAPASPDFSNATPEVPQVAGQAQTSGFLGTGIGAGPAPVPEIGAAPAVVGATPASGPSSVMQAIGKNALTIGGIGLQAANFLGQPNAAKQANTAQAAETDLAAQELAQSKQLQSYLTTGTLPPGVQAQLDTMEKSANAATASRYAGINNSGSSAEIQDMAAHQEAEAGAAAQIQTNLMQQGITLAGVAGTAYGNLYAQAVSTDNALQQSIATFAAALAGAGAGNTIKITQA